MFDFSQDMPKVDEKLASLIFPHLKNEEWKAISKIVIKKDGSIRASKPKVTKENYISGKAAYVWRMVVFMVSPKGPHRCMPVCADFDLPAYDESGNWSCAISRTMAKELDPLVDIIVDCVPSNKRHGLNAWGKSLGYINQ